MKRPKGILFDLGNTILHESRYDPRSGAVCLRDNAVNCESLDLNEIQSKTMSLYLEIRKHHRAGVIEYPVQLFLRLACEQIGIEPKLSYPDLELVFWRDVAGLSPEPNVEPMLDQLRDMQIPCGIVSNAMFSSDVLRWELQRNQLLTPFSFVMSSCDYGIQKPHQALFLTALRKLNLPPEDVWFVGDNFDKDICGASNVGMTAIWYKRHVADEGNEEHAYEVNKWSEFMTLLASTS